MYSNVSANNDDGHNLREMSIRQASVCEDEIMNCISPFICESGNKGLGVLVPPYPCGTCLSEGIDNLIKIFQETNNSITVWTPPYWNRDIGARFRLLSNVTINDYYVADVENTSINSIDVLVLFCINDDEISDVFVSNKWAIEAINTYISSHFQNILEADD